MGTEEKIANNLADLSEICSKLKCKKGRMVVLISGYFNLLTHVHLKYLADTARWGDLIVGVYDDMSNNKFNDGHYDLVKEYDRAVKLASLPSVEVVAIFNSEYDLIKAVDPDIIFMSASTSMEIENNLTLKELLTKSNVNTIRIADKLNYILM